MNEDEYYETYGHLDDGYHYVELANGTRSREMVLCLDVMFEELLVETDDASVECVKLRTIHVWHALNWNDADQRVEMRDILCVKEMIPSNKDLKLIRDNKTLINALVEC